MIKNSGTNLTSSCWHIFGLPAKKSETGGEFEKINGFASCQSCLQTYAFSSSTGTRNMIAHSCVKNLGQSRITSFTTTSESSFGQMKLSNMRNSYKQVKMNQAEVNRVKNLTCAWLCHDMRSFTTVEDKGLKDLSQEFINLGTCSFLVSFVDFSSLLFFLHRSQIR